MIRVEGGVTAQVCHNIFVEYLGNQYGILAVQNWVILAKKGKRRRMHLWKEKKKSEYFSFSSSSFV